MPITVPAKRHATAAPAAYIPERGGSWGATPRNRITNDSPLRPATHAMFVCLQELLKMFKASFQDLRVCTFRFGTEGYAPCGRTERAWRAGLWGGGALRCGDGGVGKVVRRRQRWQPLHACPAIRAHARGPQDPLLHPHPEPNVQRITPPPPKLAAEFGRFCRFLLPICWVSVILQICSADLLDFCIFPICSADLFGFCDFADLFCRFVGFLNLADLFCRFVLPICWVSVILPICSADLLGFCDFADLFCRFVGVLWF